MRAADDKHQDVTFFEPAPPVVENAILPGSTPLAFVIDFEKVTDDQPDFLWVVFQRGSDWERLRPAAQFMI